MSTPSANARRLGQYASLVRPCGAAPERSEPAETILSSFCLTSTVVNDTDVVTGVERGLAILHKILLLDLGYESRTTKKSPSALACAISAGKGICRGCSANRGIVGRVGPTRAFRRKLRHGNPHAVGMGSKEPSRYQYLGV